MDENDREVMELARRILTDGESFWFPEDLDLTDVSDEVQRRAMSIARAALTVMINGGHP